MLKRAFTDHPASVDESYGQHLRVAGWYGARMVGAGLACLVHAVFPFAFVRTGSATINRLHGHMTGRLGPLGTPPQSAKPAPSPIAGTSAHRG